MFTLLFIIVHVVLSIIAIEYPEGQILGNKQWRDIVAKDVIISKQRGFADPEQYFHDLTDERRYKFPKNTESIKLFNFHIALHMALKRSITSHQYQINLKEVAELVNSGNISPQVFEAIATMAEVKYEVKSAGDKKSYDVKKGQTKKGKDAYWKGIMLYTFLGRHALELLKKDLSHKEQLLADVKKVLAIAVQILDALLRDLSMILNEFM
ncbi:hypothetical protein Ddc_16755 [Ditylenchus destructor]|nr:hypothetical protein Ddc_16755 [Ditylenchus destructor]